MNERLDLEDFDKDLEVGEIVKLARLAGFDGIAIARALTTGLRVFIKSKNDPEFEEKVRVAYEEVKQKLSEVERGQEIIDALGDPLKQGYNKTL